MGEYDSPKRILPFPLKNALVLNRTTEEDPTYTVGSFSWPDDPDERTLVLFYLSLNEYNVLGSTIDVGSDIAYGIDALRVVWLWLRNMRAPMDLCTLIDQCILENPDTVNAIATVLISNDYYNGYLSQLITDVAKPGNNIYPPIPARTETDAVCNAATYCVAQLRVLCVSVYDNLETLTPEEALASILGLFGWRSGPLYQLIGLLETSDRTAFLADFDAAANDLICAIIDAHFDQTPVINWIATTYPTPSVLGDALTQAVQSASDHGKWALWIAVGSLMTGATCVCATCQDYGLDTSTWNGGEGAASGITVTNGVLYHVDVSGTYTYGGALPVDADGHVGDFTPGTVEPAINDLRLIAKIGTGGAWFALGVSADFTADADGDLQVIVNDVNASINFADNAGTLAITVCNT